MTLAEFLLLTAGISVSGALAPGPVTAVAIGHGSTSAHAGALVAVGHAIIELPLVILLLFGLGELLKLPALQIAVALAGGACLIVMGIAMTRSARRAHVGAVVASSRGPIVAGIVLSATNPYFYVWWATVGLSLIVQARGFGRAALVPFIATHWACDLAWLWFLSAVAFGGGRFFGKKFQVGAFYVCGIALVAFGSWFAFDAARRLVG